MGLPSGSTVRRSRDAADGPTLARPTGRSTGIRAMDVARTVLDSQTGPRRPGARDTEVAHPGGRGAPCRRQATSPRTRSGWPGAGSRRRRRARRPRERRTTGRLAALVADPAGLELAVRFVDRVARPQDVRVAARELAGLTSGAAAGFLGPLDRAMLGAGARVAPVLPDVVVPAARQRLRSLVGHLVADDGPGLATHLAATRAEGFRLNLNLLGEAVLGEREATARLARVHGAGRAARRRLRVRQGVRGGQPAVHLGHRGQRRAGWSSGCGRST